MCVDDDDDIIEEVSAAARVPLPQKSVVVAASDDVSKKGVNSSRLGEKMEEQLAAPAVTHPANRQPHLAPQQKMNGGISDISECEEEITAEAPPVRTVSPLRSGVSAAETKAHSPTRTYKLRSPERGRKTAVDATVNGVLLPTVDRSASREKTAGELQTTAPAPAVFVSHHEEDAVSQQPPLKRRKRTKTNNKSSPSHEEDDAQSDGESNTAVMATGTAAAAAAGENADATTAKSPLDHLIPTDIRFDPKSLENKPKGLVDALSNFFTPGLKRTSRTAMNSLLKPEIRSLPGDAATAASGKSSNPDVSASAELTKKVRLSVDEKEARESGGVGVSDLVGGGEAADRKRHASAGQQQVKSLYDGLSHLYSDCDSRLRSVPTTNYNEKGRTAASGAGEAGNALTASSAAAGLDNATAASAELLKAGKSPERISSPHRMSDAELKEKEKATGGTAEGMTKAKTEGEKEEKGTSKRTCLHATERRKKVLAVWAFVYVGFALVLVLT